MISKPACFRSASLSNGKPNAATTPTKNVSHQDVLYVLQNGEILSDAVWDDDHGNWKYKVEGFDLEDEELRAITIIIDEHFCLFIITAY